MSATGELKPKVRDTVGLGLGTVMLLYMTYSGNVNPWLVGAALLCLAGPTAFRGHQLLRRLTKDLAGTAEANDGRGSSSSPESSSSPPSSSS